MRAPLRIRFLSHYFPPEVNAPASRTFEHCRLWAADGHEVAVTTCVPNHPHGRVYPGYRNLPWQRETMDGVAVTRVLTLPAANRGFLLRTLNYLFFLFMAVLAAPFQRRPDVVVSTSPQLFCGLAGYFVSRLRRAPWVLEIRDLWPESIVAVGAMRTSRTIRLLERLEAFAYRKADLIVSLTDSFVPHILARGGSADRVAVVKNGVDLERYAPRDGAPELARELGLEGRFVASYVGTHGMAHGLETVLEAAALLADRTDIRFLLVGDGAERANLLALRDRLGLSNVVMLEQQSKERMPDLWALTGASLVLLRDRELFRSVIPSKVFESMAMQRPVILGVRGEAQRLVEEAGAGICIAPEDAEALAAAVRALADDPARCRTIGAAARTYVERHFDRRDLARRFEARLADLVAARRAPTRAATERGA